MPRVRRNDYPGAWFHVMNRGSARRTIIENKQDARHFLALLAHTVRRGDIELHAYCLMATHFHLLVRSPTARLSAAMQWIQDLYARWFNRRRRRDGPLFRGRFAAKLITGIRYRVTVFHYIHRNPIDAGIVPRAAGYPYSSAPHYAATRGPRWLTRVFGDQLGDGASNPPVPGKRAAALAQRWMDGEGEPRDLEDLIGAAPSRVRAWMRRKASLADGTAARSVLVHPDTVAEIVALERRRAPEARVRLTRRSQRVWDLLHAGALRTWSGLTMQEISERLGISTATAYKRVRAHAQALRESGDYEGRAARVLHAALGHDHGTRP